MPSVVVEVAVEPSQVVTHLVDLAAWVSNLLVTSSSGAVLVVVVVVVVVAAVEEILERIYLDLGPYH